MSEMASRCLPNALPEASKWARKPQDGSRGAKMVSMRLQELPNDPQDGQKVCQDGPKGTQGGPKMALRCPQECSKGVKLNPKMEHGTFSRNIVFSFPFNEHYILGTENGSAHLLHICPVQLKHCTWIFASPARFRCNSTLNIDLCIPSTSLCIEAVSLLHILSVQLGR